jgi:hypothetical protein
MRKVNEFDKKITDCFFFYKNIIEKKLKKLKKNIEIEKKTFKQKLPRKTTN